MRPTNRSARTAGRWGGLGGSGASLTPRPIERLGWRAVLLTVVALTLGATIASAQEATPRTPAPTSASLILNLMNRPPESPAAALAESLRQDGAPTPARSSEGKTELLPDGSVRYRQGNTTLILKNPCPEGDPFHDKPAAFPRPLPGRNRR